MIFAGITTAVFYIRKLIKIVTYTFFHLQVLGLSGLHHLFSLQSLCYSAFVISLSRQLLLFCFVFLFSYLMKNRLSAIRPAKQIKQGWRNFPAVCLRGSALLAIQMSVLFFRTLAGFHWLHQITLRWRWEAGEGHEGMVSVRPGENWGGFTALTSVPGSGTTAHPQSNGDKILKCKSAFCFCTSPLNNGTSGIILGS